jgi:ASCH domain
VREVRNVAALVHDGVRPRLRGRPDQGLPRRVQTVKALSIMQPWAYCITNGTKRVENRTWSGYYRGPLLIHAGKKYQTGLEHDINRDSPEVDLIGMRRSTRGAIVGVCRMIDCIPPGDDARLAPDQRIWADPSQFKFLVADVLAFAEPIPWKGMLGFFDVPDAVVLNAIDKAHTLFKAGAR